jgi:hypothetical protein
LRASKGKGTYSAIGVDEKLGVAGCEGCGVFEDDMVFSFALIENGLVESTEEHERCGSSRELT